MKILEALPELLVGDVDVRHDLVEQLFLGDLGPVVLFELE